MRVGVVINRVAGGGRLVKAWPKLLPLLEKELGPLDQRWTMAPGDGGRLTRALLDKGVDLIIAAGGDGTLNEVADAVLKAGSKVEIGVVPAGTGRDFLRSFDVPRDLRAVAKAIADGRRWQVDAGRSSFATHDGRTGNRFFLNVASLGLSGRIAAAVNGASRGKQRAGKALFYYHTLREMMRYRAEGVRVRYDDGTAIELETALVAIANGRYFGGGMKIAPGAALDDGRFDVLAYEAPGRVQMALDFNRIYSGTHIGLGRVHLRQSRWVEVTPLDPAAPLLEIDGESPGRAAVRFDVVPKALTLRF